jgi:hypothetical protein
MINIYILRKKSTPDSLQKYPVPLDHPEKGPCKFHYRSYQPTCEQGPTKVQVPGQAGGGSFPKINDL